MANKKINQLVSKTAILSTDIFGIGDATTGQLFKKTIAELQAAIGGAVISVNGLVGTVVLDTDDVQELASPTNKYFTDARARGAISLTVTGNSGASTYSSGTGVLNVPTYTLAGLGGITASFLSGTSGISYNSTTGVISYSGTVYTDASIRALFSGSTGITYNSSTGAISYSGTVYTDSSVRALISLTTTGTSGASTYNNTTGVINVPEYTLAGLGGITASFLSGGTGITYNSSTGSISYSGTVYTDASIRGLFSASGSVSYNNTTGVISLTGGNLTEATSSVLTITGGSGAVIGGGTSIQVKQATTSVSGFLSSTDWTTFNNKQATITLTTTGTSGAATFSANTLNIPQYQGVLTNPVTGTGTTNYVPKFTGTSTIGNSNVQDDGTTVKIKGTTDGNLWIRAGSSAMSGGTGVGLSAINDAGSALVNLQLQGDVINFITGGTSPMTLDSSGRLGVGTTSPRDKFDVAGGIAISSATFSAPTTGVGLELSYRTGDDTGFITAFSRTNSSYKPLAISASLLSFTGAATFSSSVTASSLLAPEKASTIFGINAATSSGNGGSLTIKAGNGSGAGNTSGSLNLGFGRGGAGALSGSMNFGVAQATDAVGLDATYMTITSTGNVGIGVSSLLSPGGSRNLLQISNGTNGAQIALGNSTTESNNARIFSGQYDLGFAAGVTTGIMQFYTNDTERMRITSAGIVNLYSPSTNADALNLYNSSGKLNIKMGGGGGSANQSSISMYNASNTLTIGLNGAGDTDPSFITGYLAIGTTTNSGYRLYVSGTIYATGNITANSDLTLKKNLELITNPTDKLMQLNGYAYQWKSDDSHQYGVIAQEVEKILPYAVSTGYDGIKGVSYNQIIPVLIEAVKEQKKELEELRNILASK